MFFYTRYPNSNLLKTYFIDVEFQKQNTAQLVKWFSNFRWVSIEPEYFLLFILICKFKKAVKKEAVSQEVGSAISQAAWGEFNLLKAPHAMSLWDESTALSHLISYAPFFLASCKLLQQFNSDEWLARVKVGSD